MSSSSSFGEGTSFGTTPLGTSPFYNVSSIIDAILRVTGHPTPAGETTKRAALAAIINNKYQEICLGRDWRWLHASYDFSFDAPYQTGTATIDNGSYTLTGVGTAFDANILPKDLFFFNESSVTYRVASVESPTSLTLETPFAEDSITTDSGFTIARVQYKLPKETDYVKILTLDFKNKLVPLGPEDFRTVQNRQPTLAYWPRFYSNIRRETDDDATYIEVYPAPDKDYNAHIDYSVRILYLEDKTTCYPIIPDRYRAVLYYATLSEFYYTVMRDPTNSDRAKRDYDNFYMRMCNDKQITDQSIRILPAKNYLRRGAARVAGVSMDIETFGKLDD